MKQWHEEEPDFVDSLTDIESRSSVCFEQLRYILLLVCTV